MDYFTHPQSLVEGTKIGKDTRIWAFAQVQKDAVIGSNCNVGSHSFIENGAVVGDNVTIKNGIAIWEGVTVEDNAFLGPFVVFTNDRVPRSPRLDVAKERYKDKNWLEKTLVKEGASLGANATIVCGTTIGKFAMVGSGSVVTKDVPDYGLVLGNPARLVGHVCMCGERLALKENKATCKACDRSYEMQDHQLIKK